jgi:hypothetical protein
MAASGSGEMQASGPPQAPYQQPQQPPEGQQPSQPFPTQYPKAYTAPPPSPQRNWIRIVAIAVVAVALIATFGAFGVPAIQRYLAQPKMSATDVGISNTPCQSSFFTGPYPPQYYLFSFTIYNTGDADGFATVFFVLHEDGQGNPFPGGGIVFTQDRYFLPAHSTVDKHANVQVLDCTPHTWDLKIGSTEKA